MVSLLLNFDNPEDEPQIEFYTELITPEIAASYLANKSTNRKISVEAVRKITDDMLRGLWVEKSEPLKFDTQKKLIDGQHRLSGVVASGKSFWFNILVNYSLKAASVIDTGKSRTAAHVAQIQGMDVTDKHIAAVNAMFLPQNLAVSKAELVEVFKQYEEGIRLVVDAKIHSANNIVSPLAALLIKASYYENKQRIENFLSVFTSGFPVDAKKDSAAIALANNFRKLREEDRFQMTQQRRKETYLKSQIALGYFIVGKERRSVSAPRKEQVNRYPLPGVDEHTPENVKRMKSSEALKKMFGNNF